MRMEVLTVPAAAELLKVDEKTVYRLIERDGLPAFKVGRQWRMRASDIERWVDDRIRACEPGATYALGQAALFGTQAAPSSPAPKLGFSDSAFTENADLPVHRWVPWIAGFSATSWPTCCGITCRSAARHAACWTLSPALAPRSLPPSSKDTPSADSRSILTPPRPPV